MSAPLWWRKMRAPIGVYPRDMDKRCRCPRPALAWMYNDDRDISPLCPVHGFIRIEVSES